MNPMSNIKGSKIILARNPLGIISLFVFFIEAIATVSLNIAIETEYAGNIVWFIILFPTLIVLLFFITLWTKRESLYSPMEFREDKSFLELFRKVDRLEVKQKIAEIDFAQQQSEGRHDDIAHQRGDYLPESRADDDADRDVDDVASQYERLEFL